MEAMTLQLDKTIAPCLCTL